MNIATPLCEFLRSNSLKCEVRPCIVAIPANNEADLLPLCLSALAMQRDEVGAPLLAGSFAVLLLANNCDDATVGIARRMAKSLPYALHIVERALSPDKANAGFARKLAMDEAAMRLGASGRRDGVILTTDADSRADPTWIAATLDELAQGADAVAGFIDAEPLDFLELGPDFMARSRLEDVYLRLCTEISALCDPRPHDPWPNHRMASGASLAVTLQSYLAIGGLPPLPVGEDVALVERLEDAGARVRHAMRVKVATSCRLCGRARGGAADTMRDRYLRPDAECDANMEPAIAVARRYLWKHRLRKRHEAMSLGHVADRAARSRMDARTAKAARDASGLPFHTLWKQVEAANPRLRRKTVMRPADLPDEIARAERLLARLRGRRVRPAFSGYPTDIPPRASPQSAAHAAALPR
jgi:hypothetical protein